MSMMSSINWFKMVLFLNMKCEGISVKLADRREFISEFYLPKVKWKIQQYEFIFDLRVIDIAG